MQGRFKMEYRLFTIVRYNYNYRDYNKIFAFLLVILVPDHFGCIDEQEGVGTKARGWF